ncbi:hypothetical protein Hanom_Chr11g00999731 [Helianthus anomalus]
MKPVHQSQCGLFEQYLCVQTVKAASWDVCSLKPSRLPVATLLLCLCLYS